MHSTINQHDKQLAKEGALRDSRSASCFFFLDR